MAPATLYRRALKRVDRRAAFLAWVKREQPTYAALYVAERELREAVRLANRLAYAAGIPDRPEFAPRYR